MNRLPDENGSRYLDSVDLQLLNECQSALGPDWSSASARIAVLHHLVRGRLERPSRLPSETRSSPAEWDRRLGRLIALMSAKEQAARRRQLRDRQPHPAIRLPADRVPLELAA